MADAIEECKALIKQAEEENKDFILAKHKNNLLRLYFENRQFIDGIALADELIPFLKRIEHKQLIIESALYQSKLYHSVRDIPKAKGALILAQATATDIYVKPDLQSKLDHTGGMLSCDDSDYKTGFSYFYESFFNQIKLDKDVAHQELLHMMMCKIMSEQYAELPLLLGRKEVAPFTGPATSVMLAISKCAETNNLHEFRRINDEEASLVRDDMVAQALDRLQSELIESFLLKVLGAYCRIELTFLASLTGLTEEFVHNTVRMMILDGKLVGTIEESVGQLLIRDMAVGADMQKSAMAVLGKMKDAVSELDARTAKLSDIESKK